MHLRCITYTLCTEGAQGVGAQEKKIWCIGKLSETNDISVNKKNQNKDLKTQNKEES